MRSPFLNVIYISYLQIFRKQYLALTVAQDRTINLILYINPILIIGHLEQDKDLII